MSDLEQLETIIVTQGAGLPDARIDVEDSDGDDADLTTYGGFSADVIGDTGVVLSVVTVTGTTTGFQVAFTDAETAGLAVGEYLLHAKGALGGRHRVGKARLVVTRGY